MTFFRAVGSLAADTDGPRAADWLLPIAAAAAVAIAAMTSVTSGNDARSTNLSELSDRATVLAAN